jgi:hypothetical protein
MPDEETGINWDLFKRIVLRIDANCRLPIGKSGSGISIGNWQSAIGNSPTALASFRHFSMMAPALEI